MKIDMADTYMCRRCGAIIANTAAAVHSDWHSRLAASMEDAAQALGRIEQSDALARELQERGDG